MRRKTYLVWISIIGLLALLNLPIPVSLRVKGAVREAVAPFQHIVTAVFSRFGGIGLAVKDAIRFSVERQRLEQEIARLKAEARRTEHMEQENASLRQQLGFMSNSAGRMVCAEVIGRGDMAGWWRMVRINKGSSDGVAPDMAVITADGLIGKTVGVSSHTCEVLLITDQNCRVAATIAETGGMGIIAGSGIAPAGDPKIAMVCELSPLRMDYIEKGSAPQKGHRVMSSGLGGIFPQGLLVGHAETALLHRSGLYWEATVVPSADLRHLRYVFVVLK